MSVASRYVVCEGREIHYTEWGAERAEVVIAWHGLARTGRDMDDVAPEVNEARKHLKQAIKAAARNPDPIAQRRLADILRRAAEEIERTGDAPRPEPEIDI